MNMFLGYLYAIISLFGYSLNQIFNKKLVEKIGVWESLVISKLFLMLPLTILTILFGNFNHKFTVTNLLVLFVLAIIGVIGIWALFKSFHRLNVGESLAIANTSPFITLGLIYIFYSQRISFLQLISMLLVFLGILNVIKNKKFRINRHILLPFLTSFSWGFFCFAIVNLSKSNINPFNIAFYMEGVSFIFILIYYVFLRKEKINKNLLNQKTLLYSFLSGFLTFIGSVFIILATGKINAAIVSSINSVQVVLISLFGYIFLKESLRIYQIIGIFLVVAGLIIFFYS